MADYGQISGSGVQVLGTSSVSRGLISGSGLQVLVVGPLVAPSSSAITSVQGEMAQGVLSVQSASAGVSPQGSRFI